MIEISKTAGILMALVTITLSTILNVILMKKWLFVRSGENYKAEFKFRILWYLFIFFGALNSVSDIAELFLFALNTRLARALRHLGRSGFIYVFTSILMQIVVLVSQVIHIIKFKDTPVTKYSFIVQAIIWILFIPGLIFGFDELLPMSDNAKDINRKILGFTEPANAIIGLLLGAWLILLFGKLISIIKANELVRRSNKARMRRWKRFLILIIMCEAIYFVLGTMTAIDGFKVDVFREGNLDVADGKFSLYNELILYNILRFMVTIIIVFFSPYSHIEMNQEIKQPGA